MEDGWERLTGNSKGKEDRTWNDINLHLSNVGVHHFRQQYIKEHRFLMFCNEDLQ